MKKYLDVSQALVKIGLKILILLVALLGLRLYLTQQSFFASKTVTLISFFPQSVIRTLSEMRLWLSDLSHFNNLRKEIQLLRKDKEQKNNLLITLKKLEEENQLLRSALKLKEKTNFKVMPVNIITFDPSGLSGYFWIDKGINSELTIGMNVLDENHNLIGRLIRCYPQYCQGESLLSFNLKIGVKDLRSGTLALIKHDASGLFYLDLIPPQADIQTGDLLVTSLENDLFLNGIPVALVDRVISSHNSLEKKYILKPLANREQINTALVILNFTPSSK